MTRKLTLEAVVARLKNVHGDLYDYSGVVYLGKDAKIEIKCDIHGTFWQSPSNHQKGQGCPTCGDIKQAANNTYTLEKFVEKAIAIHGNSYDYSNVVYTKANAKVDICCSKHGRFSMAPVNHLQGQGCTSCYRERQAAAQTYSTEDFIAKARTVHGDTFSYARTVYTRSTAKVVITCEIHGDFEQEAASHLTGIGCPKCADRVRAELRRKDRADFIESARFKHGDRYDYSEVFYKSCKDPVEIHCADHGYFWQTPSSHLTGSNCPTCVNTGFNKMKSGFLYILQCGDISKIGVTNRNVGARCKEVSKSFGAEFDILASYYLTNGYEAEAAETTMLRRLRDMYQQPSAVFDGSSECFLNIDVSQLKNEIEEIVYL